MSNQPEHVMKERPILFSGQMVRAILEGRKTQTRRVAKIGDGSHVEDEDIPAAYEDGSRDPWIMDFQTKHYPQWVKRHCPYGKPGDRLWVRETWADTGWPLTGPAIAYRADPDHADHDMPRWRPSIHMPRWASRITLEVVSVRVERLQEISEEDAKAEGINNAGEQWECYCCGGTKSTARGSFETLWESINGPESWDANPWVWVVEFKRIKP